MASSKIKIQIMKFHNVIKHLLPIHHFHGGVLFSFLNVLQHLRYVSTLSAYSFCFCLAFLLVILSKKLLLLFLFFGLDSDRDEHDSSLESADLQSKNVLSLYVFLTNFFFSCFGLRFISFRMIGNDWIGCLDWMNKRPNSPSNYILALRLSSSLSNPDNRNIGFDIAARRRSLSENMLLNLKNGIIRNKLTCFTMYKKYLE